MPLKIILAWAIGALAIRPAPTAPLVPTSAPLDGLQLTDAPIEPTWVLEGSPRARSALHSISADGSATTTVWDCTGGTFRWHFGWDETVHILEGEVEVTAEDDSVRWLRAGDVAFFPAGSSAVWHIPVYLRKLAFCRRAFPAPVVAALKLRDGLRDVVKGRRASGSGLT